MMNLKKSCMKIKKNNSLKHVKKYFKAIQNILISININEINSLAAVGFKM